MGWYTYYRLLKKYHGDLDKATTEELQEAYEDNPNDPPTARAIAQKHWEEKQQEEGKGQ